MTVQQVADTAHHNDLRLNWVNPNDYNNLPAGWVMLYVATTNHGSFHFKVKSDLDVDGVKSYVASRINDIITDKVKTDFSKYITIDKL